MKKIIGVVNNPLLARITIPGSKSITNRALLLAALSDGVCQISNILICEDTLAFIKALQELGIVVQLDKTNLTCMVAGGAGRFPRKQASIWCESAGTVLRFLTAACAISPGIYYFDGTEQLRRRPIFPLLQVLSAQGANFLPKKAQQLPFTIKGVESLQGGEIVIDTSQTGQFLSALLMIAPFAANTVTIDTEDLVSRPYIDMTCNMMAEFGVLVRRLHHARFSIPVPQRYSARRYNVEPDLSTASYFFAAAAITGGQVTIQAFDRENSKQGDVEFLHILEKMGCEIIDNPLGLSVKAASELKGVSVDMRNCSDTFMTLAAIAPFAKTPTAITNIGHTRTQESDRIKAMREGLERLQVKVEEGSDWLRIYPSQPKGTLINSHHDHRIAMAFSIMGLRVKGIEIEGAECVAKTCPEFFSLLESLTASVKSHSAG